MANYAKYTKGAMGHLLKHYERAKDSTGEYLKFGNQDIDRARTEQNYNLAPPHNQLDFIHKRLDEVYCLKRKDVNVMCSWVVTAPKDLEPFQQKAFFAESYDFLAKRYGERNVVSSYVHMDEKTPHMHFCFMPVVADPKRGEKISAKECVTRADLAAFHTDLQKHLERRGIKCDILNESTRDGNKAIKALKQGTALDKVKSLAKQYKALQDGVNALQGTAEGKLLKVQARLDKTLQNVSESTRNEFTKAWEATRDISITTPPKRPKGRDER